MKTPKTPTGRKATRKGSPRTKRSDGSQKRMVGTLIRRFQAFRREAMADEQRQAKTGYYKCAIQSHERALTLLNVINVLKCEMRSNND